MSISLSLCLYVCACVRECKIDFSNCLSLFFIAVVVLLLLLLSLLFCGGICGDDVDVDDDGFYRLAQKASIDISARIKMFVN